MITSGQTSLPNLEQKYPSADNDASKTEERKAQKNDD